MDPQIKIPDWYVITGAPSSGKTTLLASLKRLGYNTVPEAARVLIDEHRRRGIPAEELRRDEGLFQQKVLEMKLQVERETPKDELHFFDRGVPDSIAYYQLCGLDTKQIEVYSRDRYRKIFFLEPLAFEKDYARTESGDAVIQLNRLILDTYQNLGYEVVRIPAVSVEERVNLVVSSL